MYLVISPVTGLPLCCSDRTHFITAFSDLHCIIMMTNDRPFSFSVGDQEHGTTLNQSQLLLTSFPTSTANKAATTTSHTALHTHSVHATQDTPAHIGPSASSTQDLSTTTAAPSPPKVFKEICSILPLSSGGKKKRYDLSKIILMLKTKIKIGTYHYFLLPIGISDLFF